MPGWRLTSFSPASLSITLVGENLVLSYHWLGYSLLFRTGTGAWWRWWAGGWYACLLLPPASHHIPCSCHCTHTYHQPLCLHYYCPTTRHAPYNPAPFAPPPHYLPPPHLPFFTLAPTTPPPHLLPSCPLPTTFSPHTSLLPPHLPHTTTPHATHTCIPPPPPLPTPCVGR